MRTMWCTRTALGAALFLKVTFSEYSGRPRFLLLQQHAGGRATRQRRHRFEVSSRGGHSPKEGHTRAHRMVSDLFITFLDSVLEPRSNEASAHYLTICVESSCNSKHHASKSELIRIKTDSVSSHQRCPPPASGDWVVFLHFFS